MKVEEWQLKQRQALPLEIKIRMTQQRIRDWYDYYAGDVYVSFSGGKDSTVLLDIARKLYPNIPAVFCNTGLEFPEILSFVRQTDNVEFVSPKKKFLKIIQEHGYPVVSKEVSKKIKETRSSITSKINRFKGYVGRDGRIYGKLANRWHYLSEAPFKISHYCCDVLKKNPAKAYEKRTGRYCIIGTMAGDSRLRMEQYQRHGCNGFDRTRPVSTPLAFWTEADIWEYLKQNNIPYSSIYDLGYTRTGCFPCLFGIHMEQKETGTNRLKIMEQTHPKLYKWCMETLNYKEILPWVWGHNPDNKDQLQFNFGGINHE
jgi:3'-phosphoadenosine 5'-phosphosulfate sulfotransferase (PAPS reductase)/FAD synthetase